MNTSNIAIVGMACRLPMARSLEEFWNNLCQSKECLTRFSEEQLIAAGISSSLVKNPQFVPVRGILDDVDQFDANFFGLTPAEASITDPQQRLFLECAWEALEHSANIPNKNPNKLVSVFAGMSDSCYLQENLLKNRWFHQRYDWMQARVATSMGTLSTQLSYRLNLQGCSVSLNTACSTGLVAVSHACQDLLLGHSDLALAGAVAIELPQIKGYLYEAGGIHSADGRCRPFAHNANGTVFSNGVGVVVLKRLTDAIADRDTIYAVIKGCAVNNDGSDKLNYFAPSIHGQASCIHRALIQAQVSAADIGFMEAHGTATSLGDLVEISALTQVYRQFTEKKQYCALGSVKGNIGHTDIAAGIASLIKVALCLYHQKIPATLNFDQPNPRIDYKNSPFYVNTQLMPWQSLQNQRYAAVSAFGIGGTNSHLILGEYPASDLGSANLDISEQLIIVSAKTETALQKTLHNLNNHLKNNQTSINLENVAYTLQTGREDFQWRSIVTGSNIHELTQALTHLPLRKCSDEEPNVVFMFPGQGSQYPSMAFRLYQKIPFFARCVNQCSQIANRYLTADIQEVIFGKSADLRLNNTAYAQVVLFIIEYALAQLLISWNLKPGAVIGHSSGEYVAACLAGIMSLEDALFLICHRGRLMESTGKGAMLAITCSIDDFAEYSENFSVELAAHNDLSHCVATGSIAAISELKQYVEQEGKACQLLKVDHAFHSHWMEPILSPFKEIMSQIQLSLPQLPIISNLTGDLLTTEMTISDYWSQHLRQPVQFKRGIDTLIVQGYTLFIEVGPGQILRYFVESAVINYPTKITATHTLPHAKQKEMDYRQLLTTLGIAWQNGIGINWWSFNDQKQLQRVALPTYPFEQQRHWLEADIMGSDTTMLASPLPEAVFFQPIWVRKLSYRITHKITNCQAFQWIIFKDDFGFSNAIISMLQIQGVSPIVIEAGREYREITSDHYIINPNEKAHYTRLFSIFQSQITKILCVVHLWSCRQHADTLLNDEQIDNQLNRGFYSILFIAQAHLEQRGSHLLKCAVITQGSQQVIGNESISPVNATLSGICRVIMQEQSELKFQLIDLQYDHPVDNYLAETIIHDCMEKEWDIFNPILAFRNGFRWQLDYVPVELNVVHTRLKNHGVYLFTGGLGDIALILCEMIAKTISQPVFILLSRSAFPDMNEWETVLQDPDRSQWHDKIQSLKSLLALGAKISIKQIDVTEIQPIQAIVKVTLQKYGQLNGVIHAAGTVGGGLAQLKTREMVQPVLNPKIHGTYHLAQALSGVSLDFVVLCSSLSALVGISGQMDYSSANACLDAFAVSQLFSASLVVSINWNTWKEIGMAAGQGQTNGKLFLNLDNSITADQGQRLFLTILQDDYSQIAISKYSITTFAKKNHQKAQKKYLKPVVQLSFDNSIEEKLLHIWQEVLGIEKIGMEDDFFALGGHSLKALELIAIINNTLYCKLTLSDIYAVKTISGLISRITSPKENNSSDILVELRVGYADAPRLFLCPPVSGMIFCYNSMLPALDLPWSIYGLQDPSILSGQLAYPDLLTMAKAYYTDIRKIQPKGPYYFIGYSFGATLAYEIAHLFQQQNEEIGLLAMVDGWAIFSPEQYLEKPFKDMTRHFYPDLSPMQIDLAWARMNLLLDHHPSQTKLNVILFKAGRLFEEYQRIDDPYNGWRQFNKGNILVKVMPADHESIMNKKNSIMIANHIKNLLSEVGATVQ